MAPEQARGGVEKLDESADVFGLGAILCVMLTGQPTYVGPKADLDRQATHGELDSAFARLDGSDADVRLVTLARACLAKELEERPRDAGAVADTLAEYQARVQERLKQAEVARARAEVKAQEERKRRRLALVLAAAVLLLLSGVGAAAFWYQQQQAEREVQQ